MKTLRRSRFVHVVELSDRRALIVHALRQVRLPVDSDIAWLMSWFSEPHTFPAEFPTLVSRLNFTPDVLGGCLATLMEHGILTDLDPEQELREVAIQLGETHGRDPVDVLDQLRRASQEGAHPYWSVARSRSVATFSAREKRFDILLIGTCEIQMEADFLDQEARRRGLSLRVTATFPSDVALAGERACDAIIIGALDQRVRIAEGEAGIGAYTAEMTALVDRLRSHTEAPIFIDNLPEPTVQPLGFADRGLQSHRNRFRRANLALVELTEKLRDVYPVDIAAALAACGTATTVDDGLVSYVHLGSPGWMLQRPKSELAAVHDTFPDTNPLARWLGNPFAREEATARAHLDALTSVLRIDQKKCVIVDLDGVLWPGVLAETGAPFAWHPDISGPFSFVGLYFGIHEALKSLKQRGILLAAVSKNDEASVRELWNYPSHYPLARLLRPSDFVTWRVNWNDKAENIRSIASELGYAPSTFLFIDDHPIERERVRQQLPEIEVWGGEPF